MKICPCQYDGERQLDSGTNLLPIGVVRIRRYEIQRPLCCSSTGGDCERQAGRRLVFPRVVSTYGFIFQEPRPVCCLTAHHSTELSRPKCVSRHAGTHRCPARLDKVRDERCEWDVSLRQAQNDRGSSSFGLSLLDSLPPQAPSGESLDRTPGTATSPLFGTSALCHTLRRLSATRTKCQDKWHTRESTTVNGESRESSITVAE